MNEQEKRRERCSLLMPNNIVPLNDSKPYEFSLPKEHIETLTKVIGLRNYVYTTTYVEEYEKYTKQIELVRQVVQYLNKSHGGKYPLSFRVVVFYIGYMNLFWNEFHTKSSDNLLPLPTQVLSDIGLGKNTWSSWRMNPNTMFRVLNEDDRRYLITYMGAKHGQLAYMLNWIALFAYDTNYSAFVDMFGGGGTASMNIQKYKRSSYYINELEPFNVNFYNCFRSKRKVQKIGTKLIELQKRVLKADDKCKELKRIWDEQKKIKDSFGKVSTYTNIDYAIAYVYLYSFIDGFTIGDEGGISKTGISKHKKQFIKADIRKELADIYDGFKGVAGVSNLDALKGEDGKNAFECIKDRIPTSYRNKVLWYADTPYEATMKYNKEHDFDIEAFIKLLMSQTDKFIFSCRAGVSMSSESKGYYTQCGLFDSDIGDIDEVTRAKRKANKDILDRVFKTFYDMSCKHSRPLYATVCFGVTQKAEKIRESGLLESEVYELLNDKGIPAKISIFEYLHKFEILEVMITDFGVQHPVDFIDIHGHKYTFEVFDYPDFYEEVKNNPWLP